MMGMGGGAEEGDQVVIGGVPTRPSSASTTGQSNTWDVSRQTRLHFLPTVIVKLMPFNCLFQTDAFQLSFSS